MSVFPALFPPISGEAVDMVQAVMPMKIATPMKMTTQVVLFHFLWYTITDKQMTGEQTMDHFDEIDLQDCPCCGSVGSIEEEGGWCLYVQCVYCGARTAELSYKNEAERRDAAKRAAMNWNLRKVIRPDPGE